jgi:hypothetical protein
MAIISSEPQLVPPLGNLGPILRIDVKKFMKEIEGMSDANRERMLDLLQQYVVYLENRDV